MARFSKPPLASLGHCLVTASVKRRQSGCRVAMSVSSEILQSLKGRRTLVMRKATSRYALLRVYRGFDEVLEPIMYHNDRSVNRGEPDVSCNQLIGYYRYYGVTYNIQMLVKYHYYVVKMLFKWLNRRSQKGSYTWEQFHMMLTHYPIAYPKRYVNLYYG